jgi:hypothetical protein
MKILIEALYDGAKVQNELTSIIKVHVKFVR